MICSKYSQCCTAT